MKSNENLEEMKKIQENIIDFIENEDNVEEKFQNLLNMIKDFKIRDNLYKLKLLVHLISKISCDHHRGTNFFSKIEQILCVFKEDLRKYFSSSELFHIFKSDKRILLFLITENLMVINEFIVKKFCKRKYLLAKYPEYFSPELKPFVNEKLFSKNFGLIKRISKDLPDDFYEKRKIGENDTFICKLIQKDLIEEFITYVNRNMYQLNSIISTSIYETNAFLLKQYLTYLIDYAAFYGSIQIFNYLRLNGVELKSSLWMYAVHGQSAEIIHILEENHVGQPEQLNTFFKINQFYVKLFNESIKCHHNDVANYILRNFLQDNKNDSYDFFPSGLEYYNFAFVPNDFINESLFYYLCRYDYYLIVCFLLNNANIDINKKTICIIIFFI